jgi:hypothetical protein
MNDDTCFNAATFRLKKWNEFYDLDLLKEQLSKCSFPPIPEEETGEGEQKAETKEEL